MARHADRQGMRIVDQRQYWSGDLGAEVHGERDRYDQRPAEEQQATPSAVRHRREQTHQQWWRRHDQRHPQQTCAEARRPWYRENVVLLGERSVGHASYAPCGSMPSGSMPSGSMPGCMATAIPIAWNPLSTYTVEPVIPLASELARKAAV